MKIGDFERFNNRCGIAYVKHNDKKIYVIFADYMEGLDRDLGNAIGKGSSRENALIDAIKNLVKRMNCISEQFNDDDDIENGISTLKTFLNKIENLSSFQELEDEIPVVPMQAWTNVRIDDTHSVIKDIEGKFWNADVFIDTDGKADLGTL